MSKKYRKNTSLITSISIVLITLTSLFVIYGMVRYIFEFKTHFIIHFLFISSGTMFIFCSLMLILQLLEEEGVEILITQDKISMAKIFNIFSINFDKIKEFYYINIQSGEKKLYFIKDEENNKIFFGSDIYDVEGLIKDIIEKTGINLEEKSPSEEKGYGEIYSFAFATLKGCRAHSLEMKIHNALNITVYIFIILLSFIIQKKLTAMSVETKNILFIIQIVTAFLIIISAANIIFYNLFLTGSGAKKHLILIGTINLLVVIFFIMTIGLMIYLYQYMFPVIGTFYPVLIITTFLVIMLPFGNIHSVIWSIKNIFS